MLSKGTIVAGYELLRPLAASSRSGTVYEAIDVAGNRRVAVKVLDTDLSDDDAFRDRFRDEVIKQGSLHHGHVVPVYEAGESQAGLFVAVAKVDGPSLRDLLASTQLDPVAVVELLAPVADALDAAHAQGLVHRNVKPENVLVLPDGSAAGHHPFVADFGSARPLDGRVLVKSGARGGEYNYISPEQARGEEATERSDVYALGAVLFEGLVGSQPYPRESAKAVLYAHLYRPVPIASERNPKLPEAIDAVIQRAMAKAPADRFATAGELATAALQALGLPADGSQTPAEPAGGNGSAPDRDRPAPEPDSPPEDDGDQGASVPSPPGEPPPAAPGAPPEEPRPAPAVGPTGTRASAVATPPRTPVPARRPPSSPRRREAAESVEADEAPLPARTDPARTRRVVSVTSETTEASERRALGLPRGAVLGLLVLLALVGAAGAYAVLGRSGDEAPPPPPPRAEAGGQLGLIVPGQWRRLASPPAIPGLRLGDPIAIAPPGVAGAALVAGTTEANGQVLLPASLLRRLPEPPASDDAVALGQLQAYRYADLRPRGFEGRMNVYSVPTTAGVASVACVVPASAAGFLPECERVASTLKLGEGKPVPLGPDRRYAARLDRAIGRLNATRAANRARLLGARTPAGQANTAGRLAAAYRQAATSLARGGTLNPAEQQANQRIVSALRTTQAAYTRMAAGARANDRGQYNAARAAVIRGEARVQRQVEALEPLGYLLT